MHPSSHEGQSESSRVSSLRALLWSNSGAQLAGALSARLSRAGGILLAARFLGPEQFGKVATGLAVYEMLRVIGELGLDTRLIRRVAQQPGQADVDGQRTIALKVQASGVLALAALAIASVTVGRLGVVVLAALCVGLFGLAVAGSVQAIATGQLEAPRLLPFQAVAGLVFLALVAGGTALFKQATATAAAIGVSDLTGGWIQALYRRRPKLGDDRVAWSRREALRESWPVGAVNIVATAYGRLGIAVLALHWGSSAVAQYGVSYRVVEVFLLAASAVGSSTFAVTARLDAQDPASARDLLDHLLGRVTLLTVLLVIGVAFGARLLPVGLGGRYASAVGTTAVLAFALAPMFVNGLLTAYLYGRGRFTAVLRIATGNLALNAILVILLVPHSGATGAALAVVTTESLNTVWQSFAAGLPARSWTWRIAAFSLAGGFLTFLIYAN